MYALLDPTGHACIADLAYNAIEMLYNRKINTNTYRCKWSSVPTYIEYNQHTTVKYSIVPYYNKHWGVDPQWQSFYNSVES